MITIFSGTNRPDNNTHRLAGAVAEIFRHSSMECQTYDLRELPKTVAFSEVFGARSPDFERVIAQYVQPVDKFIFVLPEYNGGFPGVLKLFLDAVEPHHWYGKKAALIGLAAGRSGNLRGLDQLTNVLNYLRVNVLHFKPNLARISADASGGLVLSEEYRELLEMQAELFRSF